jgi:hypothetical protein
MTPSIIMLMKKIIFILSMTLFTSMLVSAATYNEVASDKEMYANYAQEISLSDFPLNLQGEFDVYQTTDGWYQKCFKIYLTTNDKFDVFNAKAELNIEPEFRNGVNAASGVWVTIPPKANWMTQDGYWYFTIYATEPTGGYDIRFAPYIDPADAVSGKNLTEEILRITEITGNFHTETAGYFGDEKCSLLEFTKYYYMLIYKCVLNEGDEIVVQVNGFNPEKTIMIDFYKTENFDFITSLSKGPRQDENEISYTATEDNVYYFMISPEEDRNYDHYDAFDIKISRVGGNSLNQSIVGYTIISTQYLKIAVSGTDEPVRIYSVGGQCVAQGAGSGVYVVPAAGVYVVRVGSEVRKVAVR